jgi:hypothetical protein
VAEIEHKRLARLLPIVNDVDATIDLAPNDLCDSYFGGVLDAVEVDCLSPDTTCIEAGKGLGTGQTADVRC